jgi:hypothetical protein
MRFIRKHILSLFPNKINNDNFYRFSGSFYLLQRSLLYVLWRLFVRKDGRLYLYLKPKGSFLIAREDLFVFWCRLKVLMIWLTTKIRLAPSPEKQLQS